MNAMTSMVLTAMMAWLPPKTDVDRTRYESIATDIEVVADDPDEAPIADGPDGRARTALLLASSAFDESLFRQDVDDGRARGDGGRSVGLWQVYVNPGQKRQGWTAEELVHDRQKCIRAALHIIRESMAWCHHLKGGDQLGGYTHGKCVTQNRLGRGRWRRAFAWPIAPTTVATKEG